MPEMVAPYALLFDVEENEIGWDHCCSGPSVHPACHCPLIPGVSSTTYLERHTETGRSSFARGGEMVVELTRDENTQTAMI